MKETFVARYTVTIGDINYGGHLGNDRALVVFHDARIKLFEHFGFRESNIGDERGIVVVEAGCRYYKEVFLHDTLLTSVNFDGVEGKSFTLGYSVAREQDGATVIDGFTKILPYDYELRRVTDLPEVFVTRFGLQYT